MRFLETVESETDRLIRMVNELLTLSLADSENLKLRPTEIHPDDLIPGVIEKLEPLADEYDRNKTLRDPAVVKGLLKKLYPFGAVSGPIPEEHGGLGLDYVTTGRNARERPVGRDGEGRPSPGAGPLRPLPPAGLGSV